MHGTYEDLPDPFSQIPLPGAPITRATIGEVILPLLETVHCVLDTFTKTAQREELQHASLGVALGVLTGQLGLAITLLERLREEGQA